MQFDQEFIQTLRDFLNEKGVMDEFCEAYLSRNGMGCYSSTRSIIDSFTWSDARRRQDNVISWEDLYYAWTIEIKEREFEDITIPSNNKESFIAQLRESKLLKLKRYVNALRDYSE